MIKNIANVKLKKSIQISSSFTLIYNLRASKTLSLWKPLFHAGEGTRTPTVSHQNLKVVFSSLLLLFITKYPTKSTFVNHNSHGFQILSSGQQKLQQKHNLLFELFQFFKYVAIWQSIGSFPNATIMTFHFILFQNYETLNCHSKTFTFTMQYHSLKYHYFIHQYS